jgi:hypothetical protein
MVAVTTGSGVVAGAVLSGACAPGARSSDRSGPAKSSTRPTPTRIAAHFAQAISDTMPLPKPRSTPSVKYWRGSYLLASGTPKQTVQAIDGSRQCFVGSIAGLSLKGQARAALEYPAGGDQEGLPVPSHGRRRRNSRYLEVAGFSTPSYPQRWHHADAPALYLIRSTRSELQRTGCARGHPLAPDRGNARTGTGAG